MRNPFKKTRPESVERTAEQILTDQILAHVTRVTNEAVNTAIAEAQARTWVELVVYWRTRGVDLQNSKQQCEVVGPHIGVNRTLNPSI